MAYKDLREYLAALEVRGKLHHVKKEVDPNWEVAAVIRRVFQRIPPARRPAVMFEHVKGHRMPLVAGILGASPEVYALALETTVDQIADKWARAQSHPIAPVRVNTGPVKDVIQIGDKIDATALPLCLWTRDQDPAPYEIVIEGFVPPGVREHEGPFGEYTGYMGSSGPSFVIEVTAITHRADPIYQAFFSQMPPSESSCIRGTGRDVALLQHLRRELRLPVRDVHLLEAGGGAAFLAISLRREHPALPQRAMWAVWAYDPSFSKWVVVVDEDIDIRDYFQVLWAMSWHVQPEHDLYVNRATAGVALDPSTAEEDVDQLERKTVLSSKVGVDATRKHRFPARSVPPKEDLDRVDAHWAEYGLE